MTASWQIVQFFGTSLKEKRPREQSQNRFSHLPASRYSIKREHPCLFTSSPAPLLPAKRTLCARPSAGISTATWRRSCTFGAGILPRTREGPGLWEHHAMANHEANSGSRANGEKRRVVPVRTIPCQPQTISRHCAVAGQAEAGERKNVQVNMQVVQENLAAPKDYLPAGHLRFTREKPLVNSQKHNLPIASKPLIQPRFIRFFHHTKKKNTLSGVLLFGITVNFLPRNPFVSHN